VASVPAILILPFVSFEKSWGIFFLGLLWFNLGLKILSQMRWALENTIYSPEIIDKWTMASIPEF